MLDKVLFVPYCSALCVELLLHSLYSLTPPQPPPTAETCEELFTPSAPHIELALAGVEVVTNGSGSHHQLRKLDQRLDLIRGATAKVGDGGGVTV